MRKFLLAALLALTPMLARAQSTVVAEVPDRKVTKVFDGMSDTVTLPLSGRHGASWQITTSDFDGEILFEGSRDGGATWTENIITKISDKRDETSNPFPIGTADDGSDMAFPSGTTHIRATVSTYNAGTGNFTMVATTNSQDYYPGSGVPVQIDGQVAVREAGQAYNSSTTSGIAAWGVRNDSGSTSMGVGNGDLSPFSVDQQGRFFSRMIGFDGATEKFLSVSTGGFMRVELADFTSSNPVSITFDGAWLPFKMPTSSAGDSGTAGNLGALNDELLFALNFSENGALYHVSTADLNAIVTAQYTGDGVAWASTQFLDPVTDAPTGTTHTFTGVPVEYDTGILIPRGAVAVRMTVTTYTSGAGTASATGSGANPTTIANIGKIQSIAALPLPTGAATAALQTQPGVDIGDVTINNGAGAAAVNIQDGGNSITVDGTVTTTPPSNASTNVAQIAGTATSVNSGNKDAGTLRVVLATDQPALTNKLLVTPDLPSGASTAAKQPALGTAGTASADVITVQGIASMTPLLVGDGAGAFNVIVDSGTLTAVTSITNPVTVTDGAGALNVIVDSSALPSGASTLAEQQTQTASLQLIDDAVSTTGSAVPAKGLQATGSDGTNARALKTDTAGNLINSPLVVATSNSDGGCVSVTTSNTTVLASFATRKGAIIRNRCDSAVCNAEVVYIKFAATATTSDFPLAVGDSITIGNGSYTGIIDAISPTVTNSICVVEF